MAFHPVKLTIKDLIEDRLFAMKTVLTMNKKDATNLVHVEKVVTDVSKVTEEIMDKIKYELQENLEKYFPKNKCKERGQAMMLIASLFMEKEN